MEKKKIKLTQELWAKILAFVLLGIFLAVLAAGIFAAMMQYNELPSYKNADDFAGSLEYMYGYDELNSADKAGGCAPYWSVRRVPSPALCSCSWALATGRGKRAQG